MRVKVNQINSRTQAIFFAFLVVFEVLLLAGSHDASSASGGRWHPITLETDETDGYQWAVGAKVPQHKPLGEICAMISLVELPQPDAPYVEGRDSVSCGSLTTPSDSVSVSSSFGSGDSRRVVLAVLYRPIVRKVVFLLGEGERKVFRPSIARVPGRQVRGIPRFRYFAALFKGETCLRKVTVFNGNGQVIYRESEPSCHDGGNL
jgi:hypothetical protein